MLTSTFSHIPGIGLKTENKLWQSGVHHWDDLADCHLAWLSEPKKNILLTFIEESRSHLHNDPHYFINLLPPTRHWRIFPHFRTKTAYLDIETTGGYGDEEHITAISVYDGESLKTYVWGQNLNDFIDDVFNYQVLVSFNGKSFDIPVIERYFKTTLPHAQIDLRHVLASLGYKGGLKSVEKQLNIYRQELDGVDGYFAVLLWHEYQNNLNQKALETLLAYNVLDTINLEALLIEAYNQFAEKTPFAERYLLSFIPPPANPYQPDFTLIDQLRRRHSI